MHGPSVKEDLEKMLYKMVEQEDYINSFVQLQSLAGEQALDLELMFFLYLINSFLKLLNSLDAYFLIFPARSFFKHTTLL